MSAEFVTADSGSKVHHRLTQQGRTWCGRGTYGTHPTSTEGLRECTPCAREYERALAAAAGPMKKILKTSCFDEESLEEIIAKIDQAFAEQVNTVSFTMSPARLQKLLSLLVGLEEDSENKAQP